MSLSIGRVVLNEAPMRSVAETFNGTARSVKLAGVFTTDDQISMARMGSLHDDLLGLPDTMVPVIFTDKASRNGYYNVQSSASALTQLGYQHAARIEWSADLVRVGSEQEVDLESRFAGPVNRLNDFSLGGERFHAPPIGHTAYLAGNASPGSVNRVGSEGTVKTYLDLDFGINPRFQCAVASYPLGRARVLDPDERAGTGVTLGSSWSMHNSLIQVAANGAFLDFIWHDGTAWSSAKQFGLTIAGSGVGTPVARSILHNEYERVTIRLLYNRSPVGRVVVDLTLRRGARFVEIVMKSSSSATLGVTRTTNEASTSASGYVRATSNDAGGDRFIIGSTRSFTGDLTAGGISKASVIRLDAFIGAEVGGSSAITGDAGDALMLQYIGAGSETVQAVKR